MKRNDIVFKKLTWLLIFCLSLFYFNLSFAGGPFFVDPSGSGTSIKWLSNTINWVADSGRLSSSVPNITATRWINELFSVWSDAQLTTADGKNVSVVNINPVFHGYTQQNVTLQNFDDIRKNVDNNALFVFDSTGEIIDSELGVGSKEFVVGFATSISDGSINFVGGLVVINGLFADTSKMPTSEFKAAILHEIGHLLNLDHTQANFEAAERFENGDMSLEGEIPTMYPVLYSDMQGILKYDDKIALAEQYPTQDYSAYFCSISGELTDATGIGFQGADVIARSQDPATEWEDVRTFVSGVLFPKGTKSGKYTLGGLLPNVIYTIAYRPIQSEFTGGSSIAPYDPPRKDVGTGLIQYASCTQGGQNVVNTNVIQMKPVQSAVADVSAPVGCSLIPLDKKEVFR